MEIQKHSESKKQALTQYRPPSVESLGVFLAQLKAAYPNQTLTAESAELYLTELASIHREVGLWRLVGALKAAMRECKFFPSIAELWDHIPPLGNRVDDTLVEMAELKKQREANPEKFIGMEVLGEIARSLKLNLKTAKAMPNVRTIFPDIDPDRNAEMLRQQAETLKGKP